MTAMSKTIHALRWTETWDDDDNSIWEATGPYTDETGCPDGDWRIRQRLRNNKVEWYEDSDAELMMDAEHPRTWPSRQAAMKAITQEHADILATCKEGPE